ncbi:MAG: MBG domain-containing protein, partial [Clostridia bacterium]|nr:MBG domain-containing protein [Clostridia bacterium]
TAYRVSEPTDVTVEYTGGIMTIDNVDSDQLGWYDSDKIQLEYPEGMTNAGTYKVKATLAKTLQDNKVTFKGEPDTDNGETEYIRYFNFKITPKPVTLKWKDANGDEWTDDTKVPYVEPTLTDVCPSDRPKANEILAVRYVKTGGTGSYNSETPPTTIGRYSATAIVKNTNYSIKTGESTTKNFELKVRGIDPPKFTPDHKTNPIVYNKSAMSYILTFDDDDMTVKVADRFAADVTLTGKILTATKAGKYALVLSLKDKVNTQWSSTGDFEDIEYEFEIKPYAISIEVLSGTTIDTTLREKTKLNFDVLKLPLGSDEIKADIYASYSGVDIKIYEGLTLSAGSDTAYNLELNTDLIPTIGNWKLSFKFDDSNYECDLGQDDIILNVQPKAEELTFLWRMKVGGVLYGSSVSAGVDDLESEHDYKITYDGKTYVLEVRPPSGYTIDTSYNVDGFTRGYKNKEGSNAGEYITQVRVKKDSDGTFEIYSMKWSIEKAKFDLSDLKWLNNGDIPYDRNGSTATLDPKTLPKGLVPVYSNNTGNGVGDSKLASVSFTLDPAYENNYYCPDEDDETSYTGEFEEWSKTWRIVKATIQSSSWKMSGVTDTNGKMFDAPFLRDPNAEGGIVEYEYYETDATGKPLSETPIKLEDIIWSENEAKFYIAKPILKDTQNFQLDNPDSVSKIFKVGKELIKVQVSLESNTMEYNTNPRHAKVTVAGATVPTSALEITYYDGYTRLATAPIEVGNYRVEVSLKASYMDRYEIDGDYEFDYEIVKAQIAVDWNDNAKPPVLNLKFGQIYGVEYEIVDSQDTPVQYSALKPNETYRIRAKIKDDQLNNFIFADGTTETEWKEFTVTANDKLTDPNDPKNPSYVQVDPDLPTGDGNDPGSDPSGGDDNKDPGDDSGIDLGKFGEFLQKYWQPIVTAISILLILIFVGKGIGYASERKKIKKTIEKKYGETYYAVAGTGLFGLTYTNWTIVACIMLGVAVLSLVFMILEKKMLSKSKDELDEAKEEYMRNQEEAKERRREEESRRRDEDMQMMFMRMMGGGAGGAGGAAGAQGGGFAYMPQGFGAEEMKGMITEVVTALLPGMQQMLPQQASSN